MPVATRSQSTPTIGSPQRDKYRISMDTSNGGNSRKAGHAGNCSGGRNGGNAGTGENGGNVGSGGNGLAHYANLRAMSRGKLKPPSERNPDENSNANNCNNGKAGGSSGAKEFLPRVGKFSHPSVDLMMTPRVLETSSDRRGSSSELLEASKEAATTAAPLGERFNGFTNSRNSTPADTLREEKPVVPIGGWWGGGCEEEVETYQFDRFRSTQATGTTLQGRSFGRDGRSFGGDVFTCPRPLAADRHSEVSILTGFASGMETDVGVKARKRRFTEESESAKEEEDHTSLLGHQGTRIMVHVRLRPLSKKEKEGGARSCVRVVNKRDVYLTEFALETDYLRLKRVKGRHFTFDTAFPESTGQQEVYNVSTSELVEAVVQGRNGSVFCYGATGAGKTHTMLGTVQCPGVMVLALKDLFSKLRQRSIEGQYVVRLSYLEVYNETVRDLLSPGRPLVLREDSKQGIVAAGLTQYQAFSAEEVIALLQQGNQNRTTEPTRANETSSRSHAILQVVAEYKMQQESGYISRAGKLSLIDLAGSERASATDHRTLRSLEGANINRSLLALSSCINALVEGKKHIPYRNSKLTQLLKDSLGGACQTSMIANISPSNLSFGETQNTLHWADRAKEIRTKACIANEELQIPESAGEQAKLLLEMQKENQQLRIQMARLQQKLISVQSNMLQASAGDPPSPSSSIPVIPSPSHSPHGLKKGAVVSTDTTRAQCCTPECRKGDRTLIEELQRTVRALEKENTKLRCGNTDRLEKPKKATMMNVEPPPSLHNSPIKSPSRKDGFDLKAIRTTTVSARSISSTTATKITSDKPKRLATTTKAPSKISSVAGPIGDRHRSRIGGSRTPDASPPRTPVSRFCSPSKDIGTSIASQIRKRTFWDITNSNSPSATVGRCTRSNVAAGPSLLLQPGFLRNRPLN